MTTFFVLIPKTYILGHIITLYCPCTLCGRNVACTERAWAMVGTHTPTHVFGFSITNVVIWHYFWKRLKTILKKNIFFTQGSPLWFLGDLSTSFWAKGGFYFKARELLFSLLNAKNPTPKFLSYHPPLQ